METPEIEEQPLYLCNAKTTGPLIHIYGQFISNYDEQGFFEVPTRFSQNSENFVEREAREFLVAVTERYKLHLINTRREDIFVLSFVPGSVSMSGMGEVNSPYGGDYDYGNWVLGQKVHIFPFGYVLHWINCEQSGNTIFWKVQGSHLVRLNADFSMPFANNENERYGGRFQDAYNLFLRKYCGYTRINFEEKNGYFAMPANILQMKASIKANYQLDEFDVSFTAPNFAAFRAFLVSQFQSAEEEVRKEFLSRQRKNSAPTNAFVVKKRW